MKKKSDSNITFAVIWNTDIISYTIRPYAKREIFFAALNFIVVAQVRHGAFLYTGFIAVFNADLIEVIKVLAAAPFTYGLRAIIVYILAIGHLDKDCECDDILHHFDLRNSEIMNEYIRL